VSVVQKPVQDIVTGVLFMAFVLLMAICGVQAVNVLEQSGIVQTELSLASASVDSMDEPDADMVTEEGAALNECEVVYHRASYGSVYLDGYPYLAAEKQYSAGVRTRYASSEEDMEDDMGDLYYAVYTCNGTSVIAEGYIL
jgi:hypothetical protein